MDPSPLPTSNFLPTTNALALHDRLGRNKSIANAHDRGLSDIDEGDEMVDHTAADDDDRGESDGAAEAILEEGATMQRSCSKRPVTSVSHRFRQL